MGRKTTSHANVSSDLASSGVVRHEVWFFDVVDFDSCLGDLVSGGTVERFGKSDRMRDGTALRGHGGRRRLAGKKLAAKSWTTEMAARSMPPSVFEPRTRKQAAPALNQPL